MGLAFESLWALALIPLGLAAVWLIDRRYRVRLRSARRRVTLCARLLLCLVLALAVAGPSVLTTSGAAQRWVLMDVSDSTRQLHAQAEETVSRALVRLPQGQEAGVIAFGADAMVDTPASSAPAFSGVSASVDRSGSDLDGALRLAAALMPSGGSGGVTVVSDGKAALSASTMDLMAAVGVRVDVLPLETASGPDAQISELIAPAEVYEGQAVPLSVTIDASADMAATLVLYQNGEATDTREVTLKAGENRYAFSLVAQKTGVVTYEARLVSREDAQSRNNGLAAYARVLGAPNVLLVEESGTAEKLFSASGMRVERIRPAAMPSGADGYLAYDAVVLNNIDFATATQQQWQALDQAVRALGRGLLVLGGDASYALGGYRGTVLEELLPVSIDVRNKQRMPALSLVICIDKSGSMTSGQFGASRIEAAKEAAMSAVEVLSERDNIGVIGFDDTAQWVVPFQSVSSLSDVQNQIGTLRADGGTAFYSALDEAYRVLQGAQTPQKHVIFLSDGQPADTGFENIALAMQKSGITLTTVAVGSDANTQLMRLLSTLGGGRAYEVGEFDSIPKIFTKETMLVSDSYVKNQTFTPVILEAQALSGFDGLPQVDGYLCTAEKPTATVTLTSDTEDPLLAWWNAGAGKAAAWTSDVEGAWTGAFMAWQEAPRFFGGVLSRLLPGAQREGELTAQAQEESVRIRYTLPQAASGTAEAAVTLPDGTLETLRLDETAPGQYEGELSSAQEGAFAVRVTYTGADGTVHAQEGGAVRGFSGEYDLRVQPNQSLEELAARTGGRVLTGEEDFWATPVSPAMGRAALRPMLLWLALMLLVMDIALRRLPWEEALAAVTRRRGGRAERSRDPRPAGKPRPDRRREKEEERRKAAQDTADALLAAKAARKQK